MKIDWKTIIAGIILAVITGGFSSYITLAVAQEKISRLESTTSKQWAILEQSNGLVQKHETLIPLLQKDISDIKAFQSTNNELLNRIAWKLNVPEGNNR